MTTKPTARSYTKRVISLLALSFMLLLLTASAGAQLYPGCEVCKGFGLGNGARCVEYNRNTVFRGYEWCEPVSWLLFSYCNVGPHCPADIAF